MKSQMVALVIAPGLFLVLVAGCGGVDGPSLAPASGVVTYQGAPVAGATVMFVPEKGPVATGQTDVEGKFTLHTGRERGVAVGPAKVAVTAIVGGTGETAMITAPTSEQDAQAYFRQMAERAHGGTKQQQGPKSLIPEKYAKPDTSGLKYDISEGENNYFEINL